MIKNIHIKDFNKCILLIGVAATNKFVLNIVQPESRQDMLKYFGECNLTDAYNLLNEMGITSEVYVMNLTNTHDYINAAREVAKHEFAYIVPIDLYISDVYYDPLKNSERTYYIKYFMQKMKGNNDSQVLITDKPASLYYDIDAFIDAMKEIKNSIANTDDGTVNFQNLLFVANNIKNIKYANVYLAGMILSTDLNIYPEYSNSKRREVVFDIDYHDIEPDIAFFKKHVDNSISVENLLNLGADQKDPMKLEFVHRIMKYLTQNLTFDEFIGIGYTEYQLFLIQEKTINYYKSFLNYLIVNFELNNIWAETSTEFLATKNVKMKLSIQPIGSLERIEVYKKYGE